VPIERAHSSHKSVLHEPDAAKAATYAERMSIVLVLLDTDELAMVVGVQVLKIRGV
jgi:hypothetical protein